MCENQSPARSNSPAPAAPPGNSPRAGFRNAQPLCAGGSTTGPTPTGWPRNLGWSEFTAVSSRPRVESKDAHVSVQVDAGDVSVVKGNGRFKLGDGEFSVVTNPVDSWVVKDKKSASLLAHEQGHYDIAVLCYRDMMAESRKSREKSEVRLWCAAIRVMDKHDRRAHKLSALYDLKADTGHGLHKKGQQAWESQIIACKASGMPMTKPV